MWSQWTNCTRVCGGGTKSRHRFCNSPVPAHGGQTCTGNRIQTAGCNNNECPGKITRYPSYRVECDDLDLDPWFLEEHNLALCFPLTPFLFPRILSYRLQTSSPKIMHESLVSLQLKNAETQLFETSCFKR